MMARAMKDDDIQKILLISMNNIIFLYLDNFAYKTILLMMVNNGPIYKTFFHNDEQCHLGNKYQ